MGVQGLGGLDPGVEGLWLSGWGFGTAAFGPQGFATLAPGLQKPSRQSIRIKATLDGGRGSTATVSGVTFASSGAVPFP